MKTTPILVLSIPIQDPKSCEYFYKHKFATIDCWVKKDHCIHCGTKKQ